MSSLYIGIRIRRILKYQICVLSSIGGFRRPDYTKISYKPVMTPCSLSQEKNINTGAVLCISRNVCFYINKASEFGFL